jgi:hypothetical protein
MEEVHCLHVFFDIHRVINGISSLIHPVSFVESLALQSKLVSLSWLEVACQAKQRRERKFTISYQWKKCIDVIILKKAELNTHLSVLHTIVLFPVDCNYAFKYIGREMMKLGEQGLALIPEQMMATVHKAVQTDKHTIVSRHICTCFIQHYDAMVTRSQH